MVAHTKAESKTIRLSSETLIGRSPECKLRIASGQVSRRHCLITVDDLHVLVRDLGSANGTRLNGQTIDPEVDVSIPPGSTLVVGPLKFVVQFTPPRDDDTALLTRSDQSDEIALRELPAMAAVPIVDGEETKDYPPALSRRRGDPPPVVVEGTAGSATDRIEPDETPARHDEATTTEADFGPLPHETVFDVALDDQDPNAPRAMRDITGAAPRQTASETAFLFEHDDLQQLAAAVEGDTEETAATDTPAEASDAPEAKGESTPVDPARQPTGWRILDKLRGKKPGPPPASGPASSEIPSADDTEDTLRNFLKDH